MLGGGREDAGGAGEPETSTGSNVPLSGVASSENSLLPCLGADVMSGSLVVMCVGGGDVVDGVVAKPGKNIVSMTVPPEGET